jgi:hypothetical protein
MRWIALFLLPGLCFGRTLFVPDSFATIQAAFNAVQENDTVRVAHGTYAEALTAPVHPFVLQGEMIAMHEDTLWTLVDISTIPACTSLTCLTISGNPGMVVQDFRFRNGPEVYQRAFPTGPVNGIYLAASSTARFTRCVFDSLYGGIYAGWDRGTLYLTDCRFRSGEQGLVFGWDLELHARNCLFTGETWSFLVRGTSNSTLVNCEFSGAYDRGLLRLTGSGLEVDSCRFLSGGGIVFSPVTFGCGLFQNNLLTGLWPDHGVLRIEYPDPPPPPSCVTRIRKNRFLGHGSPIHAPGGAGGIWITPSAVGNISIDSNLFSECAISDCTAILGANAILAEAPAAIDSNRFENLPQNNWPAVELRYPGGPAFQGNEFLNTNIALRTYTVMDSLDARWNFWGDSTGPYSPELNPNGRGDTLIGSHVRISPWLTDTLSPDTSSTTSQPLRLVPDQIASEVYPNPFNSTALISYSVPRAGEVKVSIFDITGRLVRLLEDRMEEAGEHQVTWNAEGMASGIYFAKLQTAGQSVTRKTVLLR